MLVAEGKVKIGGAWTTLCPDGAGDQQYPRGREIVKRAQPGVPLEECSVVKLTVVIGIWLFVVSLICH